MEVALKERDPALWLLCIATKTAFSYFKNAAGGKPIRLGIGARNFSDTRLKNLASSKLLFSFILLLSFASPAYASGTERFALLIANQRYADLVGSLKHPKKDIALIKASLLQIGFVETNILVVSDADRITMLKSIETLAKKVASAGPEAMSFVYYSGHGAADERRQNFLIPVDANDLHVKDFGIHSVALNELISKLKVEAPSAKHVVIFDACRNTLRLRDERNRTLARPKGFEPMDQVPGGMIIAFSTTEGELVSEGADNSSPYARALAAEIVKPGVEVMEVFRGVQLRVTESTGQKPWIQSSPMERMYFFPPPASHPTAGCEKGTISLIQSGSQMCLKPGASFRDCAECPEMIVVPAGAFIMGSPENEPEHLGWESPQHTVTFSEPFAVARFPVLFSEWDACVGSNGCNGYKASDEGWGRGDRPVINVNWNDAKAYVDWLSQKAGHTYRLPSEAEREYVTRAGSTTPFWWGSTISLKRANYDAALGFSERGGNKGDISRRTLPVRSFEPNPWGFYQLHGNVWEWVEDCWSPDYVGAPKNGSARTDGNSQLTRRTRWSVV